MVEFQNPGTFNLRGAALEPETDRIESRPAIEKIEHGDRPSGVHALNDADRVKALARFVGRSESVRHMKNLIERVAPLEVSVLITGPSGSGKTLVADIIHSLSKRSKRPFIKLNCASIPEEIFGLAQSGSQKGLADAIKNNARLEIEAAHKGTLLFNKITEMPLKMQRRLLGLLENKTILKAGAENAVPMDVRILSTANGNLQDQINKGAFREDLYYRMNAFSIQVPSLKERPEDLPELIEHLIGRINPLLGRNISRISERAFGVLSSYEWPGNVRELQNALQSAAILSDGSIISEREVLGALRKRGKGPGKAALGAEKKISLKEAVQELEKKLIIEAMEKTGGVQTEAAKMLALSPKNLWKKIHKHNISRETKSPART
ncbi:MAG: sigma-54-dependent Fis family transcriptional regulator [Deltaproteobacteria bacterium]|nr:sigma-54-dependent Fis family transcriptional regulator [Deltaproteobacteria bacterium]